MAVNDDLQDRAIHRAAMTIRFENRLNRMINATYRRHGTRLRRLYERGGDTRRILARMRREIRGTHEQLLRALVRELRGFTRQQKDVTVRSLEASLGSLLAIRRPSDADILDEVLNRPIRDGRVLSSHFAAISLGTQTRLEQLIRRGIRDDLATDAIARSIVDSSLLRITSQQARAVTRTALTEYATIVDQRVYQRNDDIIRGYVYVATLDTRTTAICSALDGRVFPLDGDVYRPVPPQHFNCRSTTTPIVRGFNELEQARGSVGRAGPNARTRASIDGQVPAKTTYDEWLRRRARSTRLMHFDGREDLLEAFDSGIPLRRLVNVRTQDYVSLETLEKLTDNFGG